ncbi:MAG: non-ribosomal peptide synthetase, partial [bacterium]|nr:non-ribosomal peptide synthetase [bacterium]
PDYMIPAFFVRLDKIPLTSNGKIDRKTLYQYQISTIQSQARIAPRNKTEEKLNRIWADILGTQKQDIGIDDNFFDIGGHSLRATIMVSKIHKEFDIKLPLSVIFRKTSIRTLSDTIKEFKQEKYVTIEAAETKEYYIASSAQERLYVLQQMELENTVYNMPQTIPLPEDTDPVRLENVFKKLIRRHESLRTSFHMLADPVTPGGEIPMQKIHPAVPFKIEIIQPSTDGNDVDQLTAAAQKTFFRSFDLTQAPLLRVGFFTPKNRSQAGLYLLIDMHHIITDGTSQEILTNEFFALYNGESLPQLNLQYRDYAEWQSSSKQKELMIKQEETWLKIFSGELPVLNLPTDYPRPAMQSFEGSYISFELSKEETDNLKETAKENEITLYMTILSIFTVFLAKLSGQEDIIVGTPTAGRRHADLENIIGMFVNTLAMRNYPKGEKNFT